MKVKLYCNKPFAANLFNYEREQEVSKDLENDVVTPSHYLHNWLISKLHEYSIMPDFWDKATLWCNDVCFKMIYKIAIAENYQPNIKFVLRNKLMTRYILEAAVLYNLEFPDTTELYYYLGADFIYEWDAYAAMLHKTRNKQAIPLSDYLIIARSLINRIDTMEQFDLITGDEYNFIRDYISTIQIIQYGKATLL